MEGVLNDQRTELTLNLRKQNDLTFRYEEGTKYWDALQITKDQNMTKIIGPFLSQLAEQVDISNILQEALFGIFKAEKENVNSLQEASENRKQV